MNRGRDVMSKFTVASNGIRNNIKRAEVLSTPLLKGSLSHKMKEKS